MSKYSSSNVMGGTQQAISTAFKTLEALSAETTTLGVTRGWLYDVMFGTDGTPADHSITYDISRITAAGTATAVVPVALDPGDIAGRATADVNATIEGTITAASMLITMAMNVRASYRWVAAPGGELVWPATDENGLAMRAKSPGYTGTAVVTAHHIE
jgi:hypothetical protein